VRADSTAASLREIAKEIRGMRTSEPTSEEMAREIDGRLLALPAQFGSATRSSFAFQSLVFYGLDLDWYAKYQERLKALDVAAVQRAAQDHLQDDGFTVLVVGDASVVLDDLRELADEKVFGSGGLVIVDADGKPASVPATAPATPPAKKAQP
jgi:zinc protease